MRRCFCIFVATLLAILAPVAGRTDAAERYYVLVFASQAQPDLARNSHTFAAFVKATSERSDDAPSNLESHTISWLPASLAIAPRLRTEPGRNLDLPESLSWARSQGASIAVWGPYEIEPELYNLALRQIARLDGGTLAYRMIDGRMRSVSASNCIHAVSDLVPGEPLNTGTAYGEEASALVARHLARWVMHAEQTHDWLLDRLKLSEYAIQQRK